MTTPIRDNKIISRQPEGSNAVEKFEAGSRAAWENLLTIAAHCHEIVFEAKNAKLAEQLFSMASPRTRIKRDGGITVLVPVERLEKLPLHFVVCNTHCSGSKEINGKSCELIRVAVDIFQREVEASGELKEVRLPIADAHLDADTFFEMVEPEVGSKSVVAAIDFIVEHNQKAKRAFADWIAKQPAPVSPDEKAANIIANGFALAMQRMGVSPQPAK
jgi:hypothetical protein